MKKLTFKNEEEFLNKLDGQVYAISKDDGDYICDILEEDYIKLLDAGVLIDLNENPDYEGRGGVPFSDYIIVIQMTDEGYEQFKEKYGVEIEYSGGDELGKTEEKIGYTIENEILNDGANYQAQAVLAWLRGRIYEVQNATVDNKGCDFDVDVVRYNNYREQGYIVSLYNTKKDCSTHYAFYEHRNSDSICIVKFKKNNCLTPTEENVWNSMEDKYDYTKSFGYGKVKECAEWIIDDMIKIVKR